MALHHGRHHQGYVRNLIRALAAHSELASLPLDSLLARGSALPIAVRRNAGGHYNHSLFWQLLAPTGSGGTPNEALRSALIATFGSEKAFFERFTETALGLFGSGWVWLVLTPDGALAITTTAEQDSPLIPDAAIAGTPLLALDVWEHAYYVGYQNRRDAYIDAWWSLVNWNTVNARYAEASRRYRVATGSAPSARGEAGTTRREPRVADLALAQRAQAARSVGQEDAGVIVMVFADFACPTCQAFHRERGDSLHALAGADVQLRYAHFPIPRLARGYQAAEAASCAAGLGGAESFARMHNRLYESAAAWSEDQRPSTRFVTFAAELGLDTRAFADCVERDVASIVIMTDQRTASAFSVGGTPTFVILPRNATSRDKLRCSTATSRCRASLKQSLVSAPAPRRSGPLPVAVLSGFLDAGKTTLLRRLLREQSSRRVATIVNDLSGLAVRTKRVREAREGREEQIIDLHEGSIGGGAASPLSRSARRAVGGRHRGLPVGEDQRQHPSLGARAWP
jgi:Fe-Mn family superoxide dismutase